MLYYKNNKSIKEKENGMNIPMVTGDGVFDPTFIGIAGKAAEGSYVTFGMEPAGLASAQSFIQNFKARYGDPWQRR